MVAGLALMSTEWRLQHQQYHHHQLHGDQSREFIHETAVFSYPCIILLSYPQIFGMIEVHDLQKIQP